MINGESYKVIVAEAAKKALETNRAETGVAQNHFERVFIVKLYHDANDPKRVAAAAGFSVRENKIYLFKAKVMINASGGAVNVFRPRSTQEGQGRALVSCMELRLRLCPRSSGRRRADDDGKQVRACTV